MVQARNMILVYRLVHGLYTGDSRDMLVVVMHDCFMLVTCWYIVTCFVFNCSLEKRMGS